VPIYGYAMPLLLLTTTTANTLVVAVLSRRNMRTPSNTILLAISLADLFTLIVPAPVFFYMYTLGYYQNLLTSSVACYAWMYLSEVVPNLFHTASVWLSLALAAQRYIYICHSPAAHVFCTHPRIVKIILFIFLAAVVHQLPRFFDFKYVMAPLINGSDPVCYSCYAKWVSDVGDDIYFPIYFWLRVIFVHLLPCALLLLFNSLLYRAVRQAQKTRTRLLQENHKSECKKSRENCTTMMLLVVVSITTVTEIPLAVLTLLHILNNTGVQIFSPEDYDSINKYITISNFCIICSYPMNFAVYCSMSRQFRETFAVLF
ncbi:7TM GPCR serpentine receptor class w (Srw), partial [Trinorchestia longiramus]